MNAHSLLSVESLKPPAPYIGGKSRLFKQINARIKALPHHRYVEPFFGMGGVFFRRSRRPRAEVINDRNHEVANLFRVMQRHPEALLDFLSWQLTSRADFQRWRRTDPATLTDLERAARFLFLQRVTFGGNVIGQSFGVKDAQSTASFNHCQLRPWLTNLSNRLANVVIEALNYNDVLRRYDCPDTLFYLDPPYWQSEHYYGRDLFAREDFDHLATLLAGLRGRFILSLNDVPEIRRIFAAFTIEAVTTRYTAGVCSTGPASEVLISNQ